MSEQPPPPPGPWGTTAGTRTSRVTVRLRDTDRHRGMNRHRDTGPRRVTVRRRTRSRPAPIDFGKLLGSRVRRRPDARFTPTLAAGGAGPRPGPAAAIWGCGLPAPPGSTCTSVTPGPNGGGHRSTLPRRRAVPRPGDSRATRSRSPGRRGPLATAGDRRCRRRASRARCCSRFSTSAARSAAAASSSTSMPST